MLDFDYCLPLWDSDAPLRRWMEWPSVALRDAMLSAMASTAMAASVTLRTSPCPTYLQIDLIAVGGADRGRGVGAWTLTKLCALADFYGVDLRLEVSSVPTPGTRTMTDDELEAWYGRHGFVREDDGDVRSMVRRRRPAVTPSGTPSGCP